MAEVLLMAKSWRFMTADKVGGVGRRGKLHQIPWPERNFNVCLGLTRLGHTSSYITKLGKDCFGRYIYNSLEKRGHRPLAYHL